MTMTKSATKSALSLTALAGVLALLQVTPTEAAETKPIKVWVSAYGADSATCGTISAPCLGLQQAVNNVIPGGDVGILTPLDFGLPLNITYSVNITNDGAGEASIVGTTAAIGIGAGVGDVISLRGLVIDGQGVGFVGISIGTANAVHVQNCVIRNILRFGINVENPANLQLFVSDTMIFNNGSIASTSGIAILPVNNASVTAVLDRIHLENNVIGISVDGGLTQGNGARVVLRNSVVSGNAADGILARTQSGQSPAYIIVEHSTIVNNAGNGIKADGPRAIAILNDDTIARNGTGISAVNSGQIISFGNNKNFNNLGPEGTPTGFFSQM